MKLKSVSLYCTQYSRGRSAPFTPSSLIRSDGMPPNSSTLATISLTVLF